MAWFGITLQMGNYNLKNREMYWKSVPGGVDFGFSSVMPLRTWETIWRHMVPMNPPTLEHDLNPNVGNFASQEDNPEIVNPHIIPGGEGSDSDPF